MSPAAKSQSAPIDRAVVVDGNETVRGLHDAVDPCAAEARQSHDPIGRNCAVRQNELPRRVPDRVDAADEDDACRREEPADCVARRAPEQMERARLRCDQDDLAAARARGRETSGSHQRELVRGQRPGRAGGHGECDALDGALLELLDERAQPRAVRGAAEGQRAGNRDGRLRSAGDEQRVVGQRRAGGRPGEPPVGVDGGEGSERHSRPDPRSEETEVEVAHGAEVERLGDRGGPVPEQRLGCEQLDTRAPFREVREGQRGLEGCDAPACDQHRELVHVAMLRAAAGRAIRDRTRGRAGFY